VVRAPRSAWNGQDLIIMKEKRHLGIVVSGRRVRKPPEEWLVVSG
jgi:hypothetical protein